MQRVNVRCLVLFWLCTSCLRAESLQKSTLEQLQREQRWDEILSVTSEPQQTSSNLDYYRGFALARLQRWDEARKAFLSGFQKDPRDKRFPTELAAIDFHEGNFDRAKSYLHQARHLDPSDTYINDFLGTLYYLNENLEASLRYWNRVGKPQIEQIHVQPPPQIDSVLLDHAFVLSAAEKLDYEGYLATEARLRQLGIFPRFHFELSPKSNGSFDLTLHASEKNGMGSNKIEVLVSSFRELPYKTVHGDFYNLNNSAMNLMSMYRWDSAKERYFASFSAPLAGNPQWRYTIFADSRNEKWDFSANPAAPVLFQNLNLELHEAGIEFRSVPSGRWSWSNGISILYRRDGSIQNGYAFHYSAGGNYDILRRPERRWKLQTEARAQIAKIFNQSNPYAKLEFGLRNEWYPTSKGDDYALTYRVRFGKMIGDGPFEDFFVLGVQSDSDLWIRAHEAFHERKGKLPMGTGYILSNWDMQKIVFQNALFQLKVAPFIDVGRTFNSPDLFLSEEWMCDTGLQWKVRILGQAVVNFTYGRDLQGGNNAFYFTIGRSW